MARVPAHEGAQSGDGASWHVYDLAIGCICWMAVPVCSLWLHRTPMLRMLPQPKQLARAQIALARRPCPLQDIQHDSIVHVLTFYTAHVQQKQRIVELE